jgi:hypothetical protein
MSSLEVVGWEALTLTEDLLAEILVTLHISNPYH